MSPASRPWHRAVRGGRLANLIKGAWRELVRALQPRLAAHAVSFGHWTFLRILWEADGLTQRQLSDEAGFSEPTTLAAIRAMEQLGYVRRRRLPDNRKNVYVHLMPKGRALKSKLVPLAEEVNRLAVEGRRAGDVAATRRTLIAIIENLSRDTARGSPVRSRRRRSPSTMRR